MKHAADCHALDACDRGHGRQSDIDWGAHDFGDILPPQHSRLCEGGLCQVGLTARLFQPRTKQGLQTRLKTIGCRDMLFE